MSARRDRLTNYAEVIDKIDPDIKAWSQDDGVWKLCLNNSVSASAHFETTRERKMSYADLDSYRVVTTHDVTFTVRGDYNQGEYTTQEYRFNGGEVAALRKILEMFRTGHLFTIAAMDLHGELRDRATQLQLIEADDIYDWQYDRLSDFNRKRKRFCQHLELLKEIEGEE